MTRPIAVYVLSFLWVNVAVLWRPSTSLDNGLALTPPMGWMSWQRFRCITDCDQFPNECISENLFKRTADCLVREGYKDAGYEYIIVDDCWMEMNRTEDGKLEPDRERFPNGLKNLSDYVHSKGLKFGLYEDYGNSTCAGYPGILGHMEEDARSFAEWGVDYVKLDGCDSDLFEMEAGYPEFGRHLNKTGRPMVYSCSWPAYQEGAGMKINYQSLAQHCNLWRNTGDIDDSYAGMTGIMDYFAEKQDFWQPYAGPGHWNDPDMLLIGGYGLSLEQSKTQMAVWAILAAPLLMSMDCENIRPEFKAILQNKQVIAINQDKLGIQGRRIYIDEDIEVWSRPVEPIVSGYHSYAIAFVNRGKDGAPYNYESEKLKHLGLVNPSGYKIYDLFFEKVDEWKIPIHKPESVLTVRIPPSGVVLMKARALTKEGR